MLAVCGSREIFKYLPIKMVKCAVPSCNNDSRKHTKLKSSITYHRYFEKHQTHPYQKYNSKRVANDYISTDNRYTPLRSPNGNGVQGEAHAAPAAHPAHVARTGHTSHAHHHHYTHVTEDRGYQTSKTYVPKGPEKERDREYKSSRNKYTDVRSPNEKRIKEAEREKNIERVDAEKIPRSSGMNTGDRSSKYDKRSASAAAAPGPPGPPGAPGSEWSEHISSSGKKYYYNCISEVSQWEKPREWDRRTSSKDSTYAARPNRDKRSSSRSGRREVDKTPAKRAASASDRYWPSARDDNAHGRPRPSKRGHDQKDGQPQDMDISSDRSTPVSERSYGAREGPSRTGEGCSVPPVVVLDNSHQTSGSLLAAALPRIVSMHTATSSTSHAAPPACSPRDDELMRDGGPPTPTHSESIDPHAPPLHLEQALPRKMESLGSYSSVVGGVQPSTPMLTPSLAALVRPELTAHVAAWPADLIERQAHKYMEEAYQLGCLQSTRVAAELKCSRSLVRHTEIRATLQEQKIMYLRQQILRLDELKTHNSFMSDD